MTSFPARQLALAATFLLTMAPSASGQLFQSLKDAGISGYTNSNWISSEAVVDRSAVSADLSLAQASVVSVVRLDAVDTADFIKGLEHTTDGRIWYYTRHFDSKPGQPARHELVAREMPSGKVLRVYPCSPSIHALALDPSGSRLILFDAWNSSAAVMSLSDGGIQELPVRLPGRPGAVVWSTPNDVYFLAEQDATDGFHLDLDSLKTQPLSSNAIEARRLTEEFLQPRYNVQRAGQRFELKRKEGALRVSSVIGQEEYSRLLIEYMDENWLPSPDSQYVMIIDWNSGDGTRLCKATLGRRPEPRLVFTVTFDPAQLGADSATFQKLQALGQGVFGTVGAATVNPLNGKVVGGDGSDRGTVQLKMKSPETWEAVVISESAPIRPGDGIWYLWSDGWNKEGPNLRFKPSGYYLSLQ